MPQVILEAGNVSLVSTWTSHSTPYDFWGYTTPTQAWSSRDFDLSCIPIGATIQSAVLTADRSGAGNLYIASYNNSRVDLTAQAVAGEILHVTFSFRATGGTGVGNNVTHSATGRANNIKLTIDYTPPYTCVTAPTSIYLAKTTVAPSESGTLQWNGAQDGVRNPVDHYEVHRSDSANGTYMLLGSTSSTSYPVVAKGSAGTYYYKIKSIGSINGYDSGLSNVYASLTTLITAPTAPVTLSVSPTATHPGRHALLQWRDAQPGDNNPIIGYTVFSATSPDGQYTALGSTSDTQLQVIAPNNNGASAYYKVVSIGQYSQSAFVAQYATLTTDYNLGTSDFTVLDSVEAGSALITALHGVALDHLHTVMYSFGAKSSTYTLGENEITHSFTPPLDWVEEIPNAINGTLVVSVETADGGIVNKAITLYVPDAIVPNVTGGTASPISNTVPSIWDVYVAGYSKAEISLNTPVQGVFGSTIVSYAIEIGMQKKTSTSLPISIISDFLVAGTTSAKVYATDTRGRTGVQMLQLIVHPYEVPAMTKTSTRRCLQDGTPDDEGTYGVAYGVISVASCNGNNTAFCTMQYKLPTDTIWSEPIAMPSQVAIPFGEGVFLLSEQYVIRYTVTDALGSVAIYTDTLPRAQWVIHMKDGGLGVAIGGIAIEDNLFDVYLPMRIRNGISGITYDMMEDELHYDMITGALCYEAIDNHPVFSFNSGTSILYINYEVPNANDV